MSQFIRQRLHILEKRDKPLFYIFSNLSSFLFIWVEIYLRGVLTFELQCRTLFNRVRMCVFWCSTFAYSVRFVLYSLIGCVITALLIQKSEFGYTPIRQPIHFKQMTAQLLLSRTFVNIVYRRVGLCYHVKSCILFIPIFPTL